MKVMKKIISLFAFALCAMAITSASAQNVNVNPGAGSYPTLKDAFDAINAGTHTGAITIDIVGNTTEPVAARLNASGEGAANYTSIVIAPSGGARTISGSDTVTIKLAGADNVVIDGRIGGSGRNLSVTNSWILTGGSAVWLSHGGILASDSAGAKNNIIRNLEISCGVSVSSGSTTTNGILVSGTTRTANGRNNDSNVFRENRIVRARFGINIIGVSTNTNDNNSILSNIIGPTASGTDNIGACGIFVQFQNYCTISDNSVQNVGGTFSQTTSGADRIGIGVGVSSWTSSTTATTTGSNYTVTNNIVHDIIEERTFSAVGIVVGTTLGGAKTNNLIANNVVYSVRANATPGDQCAGMGHCGGPGDMIVYNSISLSGDLDPAGTSSASTNPIAAGLSKHSASAADTAVLIKDNSIYVDVNTNTTTLIKAAIIAPAVGYNYGSGGLNYNDYYIPNPGTDGNVTGVTGTSSTPNYVTLANWQAAYTPNQDPNSIQANPNYSNAASNLKPVSGSPLVGAGTPISGITTDIEGSTRNATTPTIGAYETTVAPPPPDVGVSAAVFGNSASQIVSVGKGYNASTTVRNFGTSTVQIVPVYYSVNGGSPVGPVNTIDSILPGNTQVVVFSGGNAFIPTTPGINTIRLWTDYSSDTTSTANDTLTVNVNVQQKIAAYPYVMTFGSPVNWTIATESGPSAVWFLNFGMNPDGVAADTCAFADFFSAGSGSKAILRSPEMDFTSMSNPVLNFYTAYRSYTGGEDDSLEVVVSTDGGVNWFAPSTTYKKGDSSIPSLATRPGQGSDFIVDSVGQWRHETISLQNVAGLGNVVIGFRATSNFGNNLWMDNVVVSNYNSLCVDAVTAPGVYNCNSSVSLNFGTIGLRPGEFADNLISGGVKNIVDRSLPSFETFDGKINVVSTPGTDNPTGGDAFVTQFNANGNGLGINTNSTATTQNGSIYTPSSIMTDKYFRATYTGNDKAGYAQYSISIDVSSYGGSINPNQAYIVKRVDQTGKWTCLNTTASGSVLTASGLNIFSDFAVAFTAPSLGLNTRLEAIQLTRKDTLTVNLRNAVSPYAIIETQKAVYDSTTGLSSFGFVNAVLGTSYYLEVEHRNSIQTWSAAPVAFTTLSTSYDFTTGISQAFGSNQVLVSGLASFYTGEVIQDGCVDLSDINAIFNDATVFVAGPYVITDLNFDELVDLTDVIFAYNNASAFVCEQAPPGPGPGSTKVNVTKEMRLEFGKVNRNP